MIRRNSKRKNIGLFIEETENQIANDICRGAMRAAVESNANLFIFPGGIVAPEEFRSERISEHNRRGETQFNVLYGMSKGFELDAAIIALDNICAASDEESKQFVLEKLSDVPSVILGNVEDYANVHFSNETGIKEAVNYLIKEKKVERIAFLAGAENNYDSIQRLNAYRAALTENNIEINNNYIAYGNFAGKCSDVIGKLFDSAYDMQALICASDAMAFEAYLEAISRGILIGESLYIIGCDDLRECMTATPHLSSVRADHEVLAYEAFIACLDTNYINNKMSKTINTKFVPRESVGTKSNSRSDIVTKIVTLAADLKDLKELCDLMCEYSFEDEPRDYQGVCQKTVLAGFYDRFVSHFFQNVVKRNSEDEIFNYFDSMMDRGLLEYASARRITDLFDVVYQAYCGRSRVLTNRMVMHGLISRIEHKMMEWTTENNSRQESKFEEMLHLTNDITRDILNFDDEAEKNYVSALHKINSLGINHSVLCVYDNPMECPRPDKFIAPYSLLVKASQEGAEVNHIQRTSQRTIFSELSSHFAVDDGARHTYMVVDLYSMNEQLGLYLYDVNEKTMIYREFLTYQLSSAVKIIKLFHQQNSALRAYEYITEKIQHENAELLEASTVDVLTCILNRRGFMEEAESLMISKKGSKGYFLVAYADLDYLKTINDEYGHEEGDFAIKTAAQILSNTFGEFAIVGRIGGDEFAVFSYQSRKNQAERFKDRLKMLIERTNESSGKSYKISISLGILEFDSDANQELDAMLGEVDDILYDEKRNKHKNDSFFPFARSRVKIPQ